MNVFSKLSIKLASLGSRTTEPYLEIGYNKCDNTDCKYRNSLQAAKGQYKCKGFLPKPKLVVDVGSRPRSRLPRWRRGAAGNASDESDSDEDSTPRDRCPGTYHVSTEQAYYASHLFSATNSEHCRRADLKRDKAARKAAREARSRAVKLANEVERDLKRELVLRRRKERMRMGSGREELLEAEEQKNEDQIQQPVKRLKREIRRLPMTVRTAAPSTADAPFSPSPSSPRPALPRRNFSVTLPRPRPVGMIWDESSLAPLPSPAVPQTAPASRAPQYPMVSRPVFSARNRSASMNDVNDPPNGRTRPRREEQEQDSPFGLRRAVTQVEARCVSYKNGYRITHFGKLVTTAKVRVSPLCDGGRTKPGR